MKHEICPCGSSAAPPPGFFELLQPVSKMSQLNDNGIIELKIANYLQVLSKWMLLPQFLNLKDIMNTPN